MSRGRARKFHPHRSCGPCSLCEQENRYYTHVGAFRNSIKEVLYKLERSLDESDCVCKSCEKDIKRNFSKDSYHPRWRSMQLNHCTIPECSATNATCMIIHTSLIDTENMSNLLNTPLPEPKDGELLSLCEKHYKQAHRLVNSSESDTMYSRHDSCKACGCRIKGIVRHSPDPISVKRHFSSNGDIDMQLTPTDKICTNCYNTHLAIVHDIHQCSLDSDLSALLNQLKAAGAESKDKPHIHHAIQHVLLAVGNVLTQKLAVLFPEVYSAFLKEALKHSTNITEAELRDEMPRRCLFSRILSFFGTHLKYECKQRSCGTLLYRRGTELELCIARSLTGISFLSLVSEKCTEERDSEGILLDSVCTTMNAKIHTQIARITEVDARSPYDISEFDVDKLLIQQYGEWLCY